MRIARVTLAVLAAACVDTTSPNVAGVHVWIIAPDGGTVGTEADTVLFVAEATGEAVGLVPDDSVWWTLGSTEVARGRVWRSRLPSGVHDVWFHARYGPAGDSATVSVAVAGSGIGDVRWFLPLDWSLSDGLSQALDGTLYTTAGLYGQVVAITPDGSVKWRSQLPVVAAPVQPAIGADGTLYWPHRGGMGSRGGVLAMGADGGIRWNFATDAYGPPGSGSYSVRGHAAVGRDGTLYVASAELDGPIYAINPDGSPKWRTSTRTMETGTLRFDGPVTLLGDSLVLSLRSQPGVVAMRLIAITTDSGAVRWSVPIGSVTSSPAAPAIAGEGTIYVAGVGSSGEAALGAFTPAGDTVWTTGHDWSMRSGGPTIGGGRIFIPSQYAGVIVVYDAATGDSVAAWGEVGTARDGVATIGRNGVTYLLGQDAVYSYDQAGRRRLAVPVPNTSTSEDLGGPVIAADGTVYVRVDGGVVAIRDTVGPADDADWPTFQGNFQRQGRR